MRVYNMTAHGFDGYKLYEDGTLVAPSGKRITRPYASGQVALRHRDGYTVYKNLARLVAWHFVPNPNAYANIRHKDGNKLNCAANNLEWVKVRPRKTPKEVEEMAPTIMFLHAQGASVGDIASMTSISYPRVKEVIRRFEQSLKSAPTSEEL